MIYKYIAIEGVIGVGKTTLCDMLCSNFNALPIKEEFAENSFLSKFYQDPETYSFPLEVSFLVERYVQLESIFQKQGLFHPIKISDYLFDKSFLFAKNNLREDHLKLFNQLYFSLKKNTPQPDILFFLHSNVDKLQENIKKRGRSFELNIENSYLENIQSIYLNYLKIIDNYPIIMINASKIDFLKNESEFLLICSVLKKEWKNGINYI